MVDQKSQDVFETIHRGYRHNPVWNHPEGKVDYDICVGGGGQCGTRRTCPITHVSGTIYLHKRGSPPTRIATSGSRSTQAEVGGSPGIESIEVDFREPKRQKGFSPMVDGIDYDSQDQ